MQTAIAKIAVLLLMCPFVQLCQAANAWVFGCLLHHLFCGPIVSENMLSRPAGLPHQLRGAYDRLLTTNVATRPLPSDLQRSKSLIENDYVRAMIFLDSFELQDVGVI